MESFSEVFNIVKNILRENLTEPAYNLWIEPLQAVGLQDNVVTLMSPSAFHCSTIQHNYETRIKDVFDEVMGFDVTLRFISADQAEETAGQAPVPAEAETAPVPEKRPEKRAEEKPSTPAPQPAPAIQAHPTFDPDGDYEYTFENFIVGSRNEFAYTACRSIATTNFNAPKPYNPLFIYGPSGLGKTHLLMAIKFEVEKRNPNLNVLFSNAEVFTNEVIEHIKHQNMEELRRKYRSADYFLIDDIQFFSGKDSTQEEFFHTFNDLYQHNKQIVITSDRQIKSLLLYQLS